MRVSSGVHLTIVGVWITLHFLSPAIMVEQLQLRFQYIIFLMPSHARYAILKIVVDVKIFGPPTLTCYHFCDTYALWSKQNFHIMWCMWPPYVEGNIPRFQTLSRFLMTGMKTSDPISPTLCVGLVSINKLCLAVLDCWGGRVKTQI